MKRLSLILALLLIGTALSAQPRGKHHHHNATAQRHATPSILVQAQHGEMFQVYVDGDLINQVPLAEVLVDRLDTRLHDVIIVLTHPARKAAATQLYAALDPVPTLLVDYDMRRQQMLLFSSQNHGTPPQQGHMPHQHILPTPPTPPADPVIIPQAIAIDEPVTVSDQWVNEMIAIINNQSFDSEKLSTAKGLLSNGKPFTASQIARIGQTLEFNNSQVDFLKAAYHHCIDPENYERALSILSFSNDRQSLRDYISKQQHE